MNASGGLVLDDGERSRRRRVIPVVMPEDSDEPRNNHSYRFLL